MDGLCCRLWECLRHCLLGGSLYALLQHVVYKHKGNAQERSGSHVAEVVCAKQHAGKYDDDGKAKAGPAELHALVA